MLSLDHAQHHRVLSGLWSLVTLLVLAISTIPLLMAQIKIGVWVRQVHTLLKDVDLA